MLGGTEWIVIVFALLLLFGGRKIPELMRGLGNGIREFNSAKDANLREPEHRKIDSKVEDSDNR